MGSTSSNGQSSSPQQYDYSGWKLADRYEFIRVLGSGGTGTVYLARDLLLKRQVAVKTILPVLADNSEVRRRLDRECRLHAAIGVHPNIVTLYDKIEDEGRIYLVMEYVQGEVLADLLLDKPEGNCVVSTVDNAVSLVRQILQAIGCIHEHGILHRDIKTSNILVQQQEEGNTPAKLMDFGIARQEESEETLSRLTQLDSSGPGTPAYMAPERIDPRTFGESSPATDLYSVGVILYQLLSDGPPFRGTIAEIFNGHLSRPVDLSRLRKDISPGLRAVIKKALAKKPEDRFPDARSFADALNKQAETHGPSPIENVQENDLTLLVTDSPDQPEIESTLLAPEPRSLDTYLPEKRKKKPSMLVFMIVTLFLLALLSGVRFFFSSRNDSPVQPETGFSSNGVQQGMIENPGSDNPIPDPVQNSNEPNTTAMDMLQTSRTAKQTPVTGSALENMLQQNKPLPGDSDWQVLESSTDRIENYHEPIKKSMDIYQEEDKRRKKLDREAKKRRKEQIKKEQKIQREAKKREQERLREEKKRISRS
ncbi:MAG: protein kinase [Thermodesulfobacteriota bacterium]|nr:protein kinase [Thermodesulfobacteriota bacterium]